MIATPRPVPASRLLTGLLVCFCLAGCPSTVGADLALGLERISFRDGRAGDQYGSPLGITITGRILRLNWLDLTGQITYARKGTSPAHVAYIESADIRLDFVPLRLRPRFHFVLAPRWSLWGGPEFAWAWFREAWRVAVPEAGLSVDRRATGSWFGAGGAGGLRCSLGRGGAVQVSMEMVWCGAERAAVPGNARQAGAMTGGWSALTLTWELPLGSAAGGGRQGGMD